MLSRFKWFRRWRGGHWELYWVDVPVCSDVWHKVEKCSLRTGYRPTSLCRGTPTCEDYSTEPAQLNTQDTPTKGQP